MLGIKTHDISFDAKAPWQCACHPIICCAGRVSRRERFFLGAGDNVRSRRPVDFCRCQQSFRHFNYAATRTSLHPRVILRVIFVDASKLMMTYVSCTSMLHIGRDKLLQQSRCHIFPVNSTGTSDAFQD